MNSKILQSNKKAYFNYEIIDTLLTGISLEGTEVKSVRSGKFSFADSYVKIINNELWMVGFNIQLYDKSSVFNHITDRNRRLLAHKQEIKRLRRKVDEKGLTLIPVKVYLRDNLVKVELALCRGKSMHDKKNVLKQKDIEKQARREAKEYRF